MRMSLNAPDPGQANCPAFFPESGSGRLHRKVIGAYPTRCSSITMVADASMHTCFAIFPYDCLSGILAKFAKLKKGLFCSVWAAAPPKPNKTVHLIF